MADAKPAGRVGQRRTITVVVPPGTDLTLPSREERAAWAVKWTVEQAHLGNYAPLIKRLRTAAVLLPLERDLAADIIEKKLKRPAHRPVGTGKKGSWILALEVRLFMEDAKENGGKGEKGAVAQVAEKWKVSVATVRKAVAANPSWLEGLPRRARPKAASNK